MIFYKHHLDQSSQGIYGSNENKKEKKQKEREKLNYFYIFLN